MGERLCVGPEAAGRSGAARLSHHNRRLSSGNPPSPPLPRPKRLPLARAPPAFFVPPLSSGFPHSPNGCRPAGGRGLKAPAPSRGSLVFLLLGPGSPAKDPGLLRDADRSLFLLYWVLRCGRLHLRKLNGTNVQQLFFGCETAVLLVFCGSPPPPFSFFKSITSPHFRN